MDITLKQKIAEKIIEIDDDALLGEIQSMVGLGKSDFWNTLPAEVKVEIKEAAKEIREGKGLEHELIMNEAKANYLKKK